VRQVLYLDIDKGRILEHLMQIDHIGWGSSIEFSGYGSMQNLERIRTLCVESKQIDLRWHLHGLDMDRWQCLRVIPVRYRNTYDRGSYFFYSLTVDIANVESAMSAHRMADAIYAVRKREQGEYACTEN
jgi:hypothetical protein